MSHPPKPDLDRERLRRVYAGQALQGFVSNPAINTLFMMTRIDTGTICIMCRELADELVKEMDREPDKPSDPA
jgi:hypothetical protein